MAHHQDADWMKEFIEGPKCVFIESPSYGDLSRNIKYAQRAMSDSLQRGEAPIVYYLLYPQYLHYQQAENIDDTDNRSVENKNSIRATLQWLTKSDELIVYEDYGITPSMLQGINHATRQNKKITYRKIGKNPEDTTESNL